MQHRYAHTPTTRTRRLPARAHSICPFCFVPLKRSSSSVHLDCPTCNTAYTKLISRKEFRETKNTHLSLDLLEKTHLPVEFTGEARYVT